MTKLRFNFGKSETNCHGTQSEGESWNRETVKGPRFRFLKLAYHTPTTGYRTIFYFPSGAWWYADITFDRRNLNFNCTNPKCSCWFERYMGL